MNRLLKNISNVYRQVRVNGSAFDRHFYLKRPDSSGNSPGVSGSKTTGKKDFRRIKIKFPPRVEAICKKLRREREEKERKKKKNPSKTKIRRR
ncbi:unnamed protein product [Phyllotreta striolata]|uniref:Uncharacterized protein n=1 Tax=Phyllotreta striolata TaxID=444603 RepID=A0A9N9XNW2_PHYSR|nr:unnamed protein product [Phyllotreta striolata]